MLFNPLFTCYVMLYQNKPIKNTSNRWRKRSLILKNKAGFYTKKMVFLKIKIRNTFFLNYKYIYYL